MEFWGVEVKPGKTVKCEPGEDRMLHLSQAAIGETKDKGSENITLFVKFNDQKLVIGTLNVEKWAQISFDLVFEKDFELFHNSKSASIYFCGYKSDQPLEEEIDGEMFSQSDSEEEEDAQIAPIADAKPKAKAQASKPLTVKSIVDNAANVVGKAKAKSDGPIKAVPKAADNEDDEDDDEDDDDFEASDDDEDMIGATADSDDEDGSDDDDDDDDEDDSDDDDDDEEISEDDEATPKKEENKATPKKSANGKKRAAESASKTPVPEKKAKLVTPAGQKTGGDGKKNAHVATPHPAKQAAKTPANSGKSKQSPKSAGSVTCKPCSKSFNSDNALQAHTKAKHGAAK